MQFKYSSNITNDFEMLSDELDKELSRQLGKEQEKYNRCNKLDGIKDIIIVYEEAEPIGCVSIKYYKNDTYEVKRMYVTKKHQGKGISKELINQIEIIAKQKGAKKMILETGKQLLPAVSLYKNTGYRIITNYGHHKDLPESLCMKKNLYKQY